MFGDGGRVAAGSRHGVDSPVMVHGGGTALGGAGYRIDSELEPADEGGFARYVLVEEVRHKAGEVA